jgi:hypothetical protein
MPTVTTVQRDLLNDNLREVAIDLDDAHQAAITTLSLGDISFTRAIEAVRENRRRIEHLSEMSDVLRSLRRINDELKFVAGGAAAAIAKARSHVTTLTASLALTSGASANS